MKTRLGFVSNSSSSSFVMLTSKENHEKVLATFTPEERELLAIFFKFTLEDSGVLFGIPIVTMTYLSGNAGDYLYDNIRGCEEFKALAKKAVEESGKNGSRYLMDDIWAVANRYEEACQEDKGAAFASSLDC